jgi:hypothetical protein
MSNHKGIDILRGLLHHGAAGSIVRHFVSMTPSFFMISERTS